MLLTAIAYLVTDVTDNYSVPLFFNCCLTVYLVPGVIDKCRLFLFLVDCQLCMYYCSWLTNIAVSCVVYHCSWLTNIAVTCVVYYCSWLTTFTSYISSLNRCCYCISADYELLPSDVDTNYNPLVLDSYVIHVVFQSPIAPSPMRLIQATVDSCDVGGDVHHTRNGSGTLSKDIYIY